MERLRRLVLANHRVSELVFTNVQALLNFLPGRYGEHEVFYESLTSAVSGAMVLEDLVVLNHVRKTYGSVKGGTDEARIVETIPSAGAESMLCTALSLLRAGEVTAEMSRTDPTARQRVIVGIEVTKTILKIFLLIRNGGHMLVRQGHPARSIINALSMTGPREVQESSVELIEEKKSEGKKGASISEIVSELFFLARPLAHLWGGRLQWRGWMAALSCDLISFALRSPISAKSNSLLKSSESQKRSLSFLWYLLRPPMWSALRRKLKLFSFLSQLPLLGYFFTLLHDMLDSLSRFYFFTAST